MNFDESFFVAVAFFSVIGVFFYLRLPRRLLQGLDNRTAEIKAELDEARRLREEAAKVLADYEKQRKEAEKQVEEIIATAKANAERTAEETRAAMQAQLVRRAAHAEQTIARAEAELVKEVRAAICELAVAAAARLVAGGLSDGQARKIVDDNIADIGTQLQ